MSHMHYFPLGVGVATLFFAILLGLLFLIQIRLLGHAYSALGLDPRVATLVLFGSLLGSYVNLPLIRLPTQRVVSREVVEIFGVPFLAPVTVDWPGTILAINVGGAKPGAKGGGKKLIEIQGTTSVTDLVNVLNELGVSPKDLTAIFQALKSAGALEGELEVN